MYVKTTQSYMVDHVNQFPSDQTNKNL